MGGVGGVSVVRIMCLAKGLTQERKQWTAVPLPLPPWQVFVPKEDLSLDVIKQYRVVSWD